MHLCQPQSLSLIVSPRSSALDLTTVPKKSAKTSVPLQDRLELRSLRPLQEVVLPGSNSLGMAFIVASRRVNMLRFPAVCFLLCAVCCVLPAVCSSFGAANLLEAMFGKQTPDTPVGGQKEALDGDQSSGLGAVELGLSLQSTPSHILPSLSKLLPQFFSQLVDGPPDGS